MAAALEQQALVHRAPPRLADIDAYDGTARAGPRAARFERKGEGGSAVAFLQPRCHQSDHAGMPARPCGDDAPALLLEPECGHGFGFRLRDGGKLDLLTLTVEAVELNGDARRFAFVFLPQP